MASHVVVLDASARRATIKTTPGKYLTDILHEACEKLGRNADSHGLKLSNKPLDLSRNVRLAGLSSGAKLELVTSSRSPTVVSVALQLPETTSKGISRLTDKFPSNTTLWMVLRHFESCVDGTMQNYTGRGIPVPDQEQGTAGRLYFETPVIQFMGRELSSFADLQKTLAQIGFSSGSALLRLSFRRTEQPLEDAMQEMTQYFHDTEPDLEERVQEGSATESKPIPGSDASVVTAETTEQPSSPAYLQPNPSHVAEGPKPSQDLALTTASRHQELPTKGISHRPVTVFAPPSSDTPKAAQNAFNERDYEPTIDHAKLHQSRLAATGANKRLPSDAELVAHAELQAQRHANVKEIEIKIRFPDQMQVVSTFSNTDTANYLHGFVKGLMLNEHEPFSLKYASTKGSLSIPSGSSGEVKLVTGLGMTGRVLVNVVWEEGATLKARESPVLKEQYREKAREIEVKQIEGTAAEEDKETSANKAVAKERKDRTPGVPKWLKLPGKKS